MNGQKATALEDFCKSLGHAFIRYTQSIVLEKMKLVSCSGGRGFNKNMLTLAFGLECMLYTS